MLGLPGSFPPKGYRSMRVIQRPAAPVLRRCLSYLHSSLSVFSVHLAQNYMLALLAQFDNSLSPMTVDGEFGPSTTRAVRVTLTPTEPSRRGV
mgnify:CR=1 FL=1